MARTQVKSTNIANRDLTGASFISQLAFFDETANYQVGDVVIWDGRWYKVAQDITGGQEGDLSNSPSNNPDLYDEIPPVTIDDYTYNLNAGDSITVDYPSGSTIVLTTYKNFPYQQNVDEYIDKFARTTEYWNYNDKFIYVDNNGAYVRRIVPYSNSYNGTFFSSEEINPNNFSDIVKIMVS